MAKLPDRDASKDEPDLDFAPDAWERFEATVDKVAKAPQHRALAAR
jgi:hypothetical protein